MIFSTTKKIFSREWKMLFSFKVVSFLFLSFIAFKGSAFASVIKDGSIDLRSLDFDISTEIPLKGEWKFYWKEFLEPDDFMKPGFEKKGIVLNSGNWSDDGFNPKGYGSFYLKVKTRDYNRVLGLSQKYYQSAVKVIFFEDDIKGYRKKVFSSGRPAKLKKNEIPYELNKILPFSPRGEEFHILIHVSNFHYRYGALGNLSIGDYAKMVKERRVKDLINSSILGIAFIMAIYQFFIYLVRSKDSSSFFLGLYFISFFVWFLCNKNYPDIFYEDQHQFFFFVLIRKIEYFSWFILNPAYYSFLRRVYPKDFSRTAEKLLWTLISGFFLYVLLSDIEYARKVTPFFRPLYLAMPLMIGFYLFKAFAKGREGRVIALVGLLLIAFANLNDSLYFSGFPILPFLVLPYSTVIFILLQSLLLARLFAKTFDRAEALTKNLQKEVEARTQNLLEAQQRSEEARIFAERSRQEALDAKIIAESFSEKLEMQAEQLKESDNQKTRFFQNMSDELRSPLSLILSSLNSLKKELSDNDHLKIGIKNSNRLLWLVNHLLDFQKITSGDIEIKFSPIAVRSLLETISASFKSVASKKDLDLVLSMPGQRSPLILAQADVLEKVLFNYLANAFRFSVSGSKIELGYKILGASDNEQFLRLFVKDFGPGIKSSEQGKLFRLFAKLDHDASDSGYGAGLGLALSKEFAKLLKAKVGVISESGKGAEFFIDFKIYEDQKNVFDLLVVDDDEEVIFSLQTLFAVNNFDCDIAYALNAKEAREILKHSRPKCILTDARMPEEDGGSLLAFVDEISPLTKKVLFTGYASEDILGRAVDHGKCSFIVEKPWDADHLLTLLGNLIRQSGLGEIESSVENTTHQSIEWIAQNQSPANKAKLQTDEVSGNELILVVEDNRDIRSYLEAFLDDNGYRVFSAENGEDAFEKCISMQPDLVITDWMMPVFNGFELIEKLRSEKRFESVPVIVLSVRTDEEFKRMAIAKGADAYLGKPYNETELIDNISNLLKLKSKEKSFIKELKLAASLQDYLNRDLDLSHGPISVSGYFKSWNEVGGDFMLAEKLNDEFIFVFQGDVSGHGPQAALLSFYLRGVVDNYLIANKVLKNDEDSFLDKMVDTAATQMEEKVEENLFATFFAALLNVKTKELWYRNGGHPPAFYFSSQSEKIKPLGITGSPLGVEKTYSRPGKDSNFRFCQGDRLLILNDSFTELPGFKFKRDYVGIKRLLKISESFFKEGQTAAPNYVDFVLKKTENQGSGFNDDCSVLIICES